MPEAGHTLTEIERQFRKDRPPPPGVPVCRECGCWQEDACWDEESGPCDWVEPGLCSFCEGASTSLHTRG